MEKTKIQKIIKDIVFWTGVAVVIGALAWVIREDTKRTAIVESARKDAICPALLSVSRSARDTLIVMKAEPLCNVFVLDSLK
jgi:hypothetical protein